MPRSFVSIASAPGWNARFAEEHGIRAVTLACWALVEEEDGARNLVGMVQRRGTPERPHGVLQAADEVDGFQGYSFTGLLTKQDED